MDYGSLTCFISSLRVLYNILIIFTHLADESPDSPARLTSHPLFVPTHQVQFVLPVYFLLYLSNGAWLTYQEAYLKKNGSLLLAANSFQ